MPLPRPDHAGIARTRPAPAVLIALAALLLGALAVVLAASPVKSFELDRYFVPKELVLHLAAAIAAGSLALRRDRRLVLDRADTLLLAFAALSTLSALFATNHWLAFRSLAVTLSGLAIFWSARAVAGSGARRVLVGGIVLATVVAAATSLAQAYGAMNEYFTLARAPGGTLGNRNFVAHLAAIGVPLLLWSVATARHRTAVAGGVVAAAVLSATLVLSRTRAAWLAVLVSAALLARPALGATRRLDTRVDTRVGPRVGPRVALLALAAVLGAGIALALPNRLNWKSDSPYLDSVRGMVNAESGSGHGRLVQYRHSLEMARAFPVLGVGPGNWGVHYPRFAAPSDPSLNSAGMTSNPWPSSDWVAFVAERGVAATVMLLLAILVLVVNTWLGSTRGVPGTDAAMPVALTGIVLVTGAVGSLDAVLLIAPPSFLVWAALGALSVPGRERIAWSTARGTQGRRLAFAGVVALVLFAARSAAAVQAMADYGTGTSLAAVRRAARWDPGAYRIVWRLAQLEAARHGCATAAGPARRAAGMFPAARGPRVLMARCRRR